MSWWTSPNLHPKTKNRFVVVFSNAFYLPNIKSLNKPSVDIETKEYRLLNHTFNYPGNAKWKPVTLKFVDMNGTAATEDTHFDTSAFLWQMLNNTGYAYPYFDESSIREPMYMNVGKQGEIQGKGHHISTKINFRDDPRTDVVERDSWRTITTPEKSSNIANSFGLGLEGEIDMKKAGVSRQRVAIYQVSPDSIINEAWYLVNPIVKSINWGDLAYEDDALVEYELQIVYDWAILDRQANGTKLVVDEEPYKHFMTTLKSNKDTIGAEERLTRTISTAEARMRADMEEFYANQYSPGTVEELTSMDPPVADSFIDDIQNAQTPEEIEQILDKAKGTILDAYSAADDVERAVRELDGLQLYADDRNEELAQGFVEEYNSQNLFADVGGDFEDDFTYDEEGYEELQREGYEAENILKRMEDDEQRRNDAEQNLLEIERLEQEFREERNEAIRDYQIDKGLEQRSQEAPYDPAPSRTDEEFDLEYNRKPSPQVTLPEEESGLGAQSYLDQLDKEKEELEAFEQQLARQRFSETETD